MAQNKTVSGVGVDYDIEVADDRAGWLINRGKGLGASDVAKSLNAEPGRLHLWHEKAGNLAAEDLSGDEWVQWGLDLEPAMREVYCRRFDIGVRTPPAWTICRSIRWPWLSCTPDGWTLDGHLQLKTINAHMAHQWSVKPPDKYIIQCQAEMVVLGTDSCWLVALFGGCKMERYQISLDADEAEYIVAVTGEFWTSIQAGCPPEANDTEEDLATVKTLHPEDDGSTVFLGQRAGELLDRINSAKARRDIINAEIRFCESYLRTGIGNSTFGELADGRGLSLKTTARKGYTSEVKPTTFRNLKEIPNRDKKI